MAQKFFNPLMGITAHNRFIDLNKNPANGYRAGYEWYMRYIPVINDCDSNNVVQGKLFAMSQEIKRLAYSIKNEKWLHENWPTPGSMLTRTVLAIDRDTNAQIVLVRFNISETPIHGHMNGQMMDMLIEGVAGEINYRLVNAEERLVEQYGEPKIFCGENVLSNSYYKPGTASRSSLIHKFIAQTKCITLHFIPEMPRDGKDNLFTEVSTIFSNH